MKIISHLFYSRDTVDVARDLLGKTLVRKIGNNIISGIITETEAYRYKDDPASHAFAGLTERNKAMFGSVGMAYVYFTYGMHYCMNAVARDGNYEAGAVLIRALDPKEGVNFMVRQRKTDKISNLTNGPAKLTQALQITKKQYGADLTKPSSLFIMDGIKIKESEIVRRQRIGIKKAINHLWNFSIQN